MQRIEEINSLEEYSVAIADYLVAEWGVKDDLGIATCDTEKLAFFIEINYEMNQSINNVAGNLLKLIRNKLQE